MAEQEDVDQVFREFQGSPEFQSADRQTQALLTEKFQNEIGTPSTMKGAGPIRGLASGVMQGLGRMAESAERAGFFGTEPLQRTFEGLSEDVLGGRGLSRAGELAQSIGSAGITEAPAFVGAGGMVKFGLKGLSVVAEKAGLSATAKLASAVAKADKLYSSTAREAVTGYVYGELADKDPLAEAATFGVIGAGAGTVGRLWRLFRKGGRALPAPGGEGAGAAPPVPAGGPSDVVVGRSSSDLVKKARERYMNQQIEATKALPSAPPSTPLALPPGEGSARTALIQEPAGLQPRTAERQASLTSVLSESPLDASSVIRKPLARRDAAEQLALRQKAMENPYMADRTLPPADMDPALTGTPDGLALLQRLRNERQLRREAINAGYPEDVVNEASNASLWEAMARKAKPEEVSVVYGGPKPVLVPKQLPAPVTGGVSVNMAEGAIAVRLPGPHGMDVTAVADSPASLARAEKAPGVKPMLDGLDAIMEIDEALISPVEYDVAWVGAKGAAGVEPLAAQGMKIFSGKVRSRDLARAFTASEEIFNRAGRYGREFRERASQSQDLATFVHSRAAGSTGLQDALAKVTNWDAFLDAYQLGKGKAGVSLSEVNRTMRFARAEAGTMVQGVSKGLRDLASQESGFAREQLLGFNPEALTKTRQVMDAMGSFFEEHGVMTNRWDSSRMEWTKIPFQRLPNFLPAVPNPKAIAAKLKDPAEIVRIAEKYKTEPDEIRQILEKMVAKDTTTGTANVDFVSRTLNPQGAEMYNDFGLLTDMSKAIPEYIASRAKALGLLRGFGGMEPAQVKALSAAARAGDSQALAALQARSGLPLVSELKQRILADGGDPVLVETAGNQLLGRSNMIEGDQLIMKGISAWQTLKLGKTAILNASELSLLADKFGTGATLKEIGNVARYAVTGKGRMFDPRAWDEATVAFGEAARDTFGFSPEQFSRWYLKWTGFKPTDVTGRAVALKLGPKWISRTSEMAIKGEVKAVRDLEQLGVNMPKLRDTGSLSKFDMARANYRLMESLLPVSRADKLPPGWRDSLYGRVFSMFQSWGFQHSKRMKLWAQTDPKRMIKSLAYFVPSTYTALYLRRKISAVGTDREVNFVPEKATDILFDLPLMTSIFGSFGNALLVLHPSGDFQARRTLEGPVFGSLFSLMQATKTIGQYMESDDPDASKVMLGTTQFLNRELSGVPGAGFVTEPLVNQFKPSPLERRVKQRMKR